MEVAGFRNVGHVLAHTREAAELVEHVLDAARGSN
jgi:hypothetical protein